MGFDRDRDWEGRVTPLSKERVRRVAPDLHAIQRAALEAAEVTGDEHWDFFVSVIKAKVEDLMGQLEVTEEALKNSDDFTTSVLINQKLAVRIFGSQIETLNWVLELPKALLEKGDRATELLKTIEESAD